MLASGGSTAADAAVDGHADWSTWRRRRAGRARRARDPGGVRDEQPRRVGGVADGADAARRGHAGGDPRVRRPHHRTAPFAFKESSTASGRWTPVLRCADPERTARVAGLAVRPRPPAPHPAPQTAGRDRALEPTRPSTPGSATPSASTRRLGHRLLASACAGAGLSRSTDDLADGDELIHALIAAGGHDARLAHRGAARRRRRPACPWPTTSAGSPPCRRRCATRSSETWGRPPGEVLRRRRRRRARRPAARQRARRHPAAARVRREPDRDLPRPRHRRRAPLPRRLPLAGSPASGASAPTRSSTSASTARSSGCRARASGSSAECAPDAALGDLPLFYPFVVNDPGEGTQAKRRAHAVIVDHLVPPMTRADTYDELARLEQLLDEYAAVAALDPGKVPALAAARSGSCWSRPRSTATSTSTTRARRRRVRRRSRCTSTATCASSRTRQIRGGLHVLGRAPEGEQLDRLLAAILRLAVARARPRPAARDRAPPAGLDVPALARGRRRRGGRRPPGPLARFPGRRRAAPTSSTACTTHSARSSPPSGRAATTQAPPGPAPRCSATRTPAW